MCCFLSSSSAVLTPASGLQGCGASVERWLLTNIGVVLGVCVGVAVIEVLLQKVIWI